MADIKAIVVDDEEGARDVLSNLLARTCPEVKVLEKCSNVLEAVEKIKEHKPDVVFLDVEMPNYAGYELVNFFDAIDFEIIFVTAFDQYAIKAFELSAIDYLVKPVSRIRLAEAIEKLQIATEHKAAAEKYQVLLDTMKKKEFEKIVIPELGNRRVLSLKDIIAVEGKGAYSVVHYQNEKDILVSKSLKYFESVFPEDSSFYRPHKSWIINLNHLKSFHKGKHLLTLTGEIEAKVSKYKLSEFEAAIQ